MLERVGIWTERTERQDGRCAYMAKGMTTNTPHRRFGFLQSGESINWISGKNRTDIIDKGIWAD
jgi:hypothetical protein